MPADLFIGLVTHPSSRFAEAATDRGLSRSVAREAERQGCATTMGVSDLDAWAPELLPITSREVARSVEAEIDSEARWRQYVAGGPLNLRSRVAFAARLVRRRFRYAPPWRRDASLGDPGPRMVRRLANIELSHLRLMHQAIDSEARWCLILEDDAAAVDPARFTRELLAFMAKADERGQPVTINLSESFTPDQLGITALLRAVDEKDPDPPWHLFAADRPITNTVCAVLYRRDYLCRLVGELDAIPLSPVIPIDFKVNEAVMRLAPSMRPGDCWVASPAPLMQRSGVPSVPVKGRRP